MIKLIAVLALWSFAAVAGLPPTTLKGQSETTPSTTFSFQAPYNQATRINGTTGLLETGNQNLLINPSFEASNYSQAWIISLIAGASTTQNTTNVVDGKSATNLTWGAGKFIAMSQDITPTVNLASVNLQASCMVNTSTAGAQVCARVNGVDQNCQNVPASGTWQSVTSNFIGPASGTSVGIDVVPLTTAAGSLIVDQCYVGKATNLSQVSQAQSLGGIVWVQNSNNWTISSATTSFAPFPANASVPAPSTTGVIVAPATRIPALTIPSAGPGTYYLVASGTFTAGTAGKVAYFGFSDGTTVGGSNAIYASSALAAGPMITGTFNYSTSQTNLTFNIVALSNAAAASLTIGDGETTDVLNIQVYYFPTQQQAGYRPDATPASWSGYQTVASGWTTTSATYAAPSAGTTVVTNQLTGINMTCSSFGTASGITCNLPRAGRYNVCATVNWTNSGNNTSSLEVVDGSGAAVTKGSSATTITGGSYTSTGLCGQYAASNSGSTSFQIFAATNGGTLTIPNGVATGSAAISWNITELDAPMPAPYLVGSVTSTSAGQEHAERIVFTGAANATTSCTSSPCYINDQSGAFSSVTRTGTGLYTVNVNPGVFSKTPTCTTAHDQNTGGQLCPYNYSASTATTLSFQNLNSAFSQVDGGCSIICTGPR